MISKSSNTYKELEAAAHALVNGVVLVIDPSIGSNSSMPGVALYQAGEFESSATLKINPNDSIPARLQKLSYYMRKFMQEYKPDVLVYEQIPAQRHGGGNAWAHASLLKAVGVTLSVAGPDHYVGLFPVTWKKLVRSDYVKSDERDAEEMGFIAIEAARAIIAEGARGYGKRKKRAKKAA